MSRSAAPLGGLRNGKADISRAPKTGHSICSRHCGLRKWMVLVILDDNPGPWRSWTTHTIMEKL